jgi:hypothetical protein
MAQIGRLRQGSSGRGRLNKESRGTESSSRKPQIQEDSSRSSDIGRPSRKSQERRASYCYGKILVRKLRKDTSVGNIMYKSSGGRVRKEAWVGKHMEKISCRKALLENFR